jgi:hypothetical protein
VRLHERGGKRHEMPAHHKLEAFIDEYPAAAGICEANPFPLGARRDGRAHGSSAFNVTEPLPA